MTSPSNPAAGRSMFVKVIYALSLVCGWIAAAMIVASVLITCQMIFVRAVLNESTIWQTEAVVYLMITATLLGLPYVQRLRGHVSVDLLPMMLPHQARRVLITVTLLASAAVIVVMLFYGIEQWHMAWERGWRSDTVWGVRLWIPYLALPVGFGVYLLQLLVDLGGAATDADPTLEPGGHE
ncbi:MAG: TRAP transporter small permease [Rhodospirillales bacterium]